jgi:hypothetical protein
MKTKLFFTVVVLGMTLGAQATIWRVNNDPNAGADFAQLQEANDDASVMPGDTIHMEHSSVLYETATINKQLVIIGTGYFLEQNLGQQYTALDAMLRRLNIAEAANGTVVMGIHFPGTGSTGTDGIVYVSASNVRIENCRFKKTLLEPNGFTVSGISIRNNYGEEIGTSGFGTIANISVVGNIIGLVSLTHLGTNNSVLAPISITGNYCGTINARSAVIRNNIVKSQGNILSISTYNTVEHCVFSFPSPTDPNSYILGTNNLFEQEINSVINSVNGTVTNNSNIGESEFELIPGSPAIGAGFNGVDCGPWAAGYVLAGTPDVPSVYFLNAGPTGTQNGLNVTFSTRSNP